MVRCHHVFQQGVHPSTSSSCHKNTPPSLALELSCRQDRCAGARGGEGACSWGAHRPPHTQTNLPGEVDAGEIWNTHAGLVNRRISTSAASRNDIQVWQMPCFWSILDLLDQVMALFSCAVLCAVPCCSCRTVTDIWGASSACAP